MESNLGDIGALNPQSYIPAAADAASLLTASSTTCGGNFNRSHSQLVNCNVGDISCQPNVGNTKSNNNTNNLQLNTNVNSNNCIENNKSTVQRICSINQNTGHRLEGNNVLSNLSHIKTDYDLTTL